MDTILDISHHQQVPGSGVVFDFHKALANGAKGCIIRAGSINSVTGVCYDDHQWATNSVLGPPVMPCGSYWYFRVKWDAIKQARFYAGLLVDKDMKLPPCLDFEENELLLSKAKCNEKAKFFVEELESLVGVQPMIYTSKSKWDQFVGVSGWAHKYKLWVAHYTTAPAPWVPVEWMPDNWTGWQYTDKGDGLAYGAQSKQIDVSRFKDGFLHVGATLEQRVAALEALHPGGMHLLGMP